MTYLLGVPTAEGASVVGMDPMTAPEQRQDLLLHCGSRVLRLRGDRIPAEFIAEIEGPLESGKRCVDRLSIAYRLLAF